MARDRNGVANGRAGIHSHPRSGKRLRVTPDCNQEPNAQAQWSRPSLGRVQKRNGGLVRHHARLDSFYSRALLWLRPIPTGRWEMAVAVQALHSFSTTGSLLGSPRAQRHDSRPHCHQCLNRPRPCGVAEGIRTVARDSGEDEPSQQAGPISDKHHLTADKKQPD